MMVIKENFYANLTRVRIHHYSCLYWTFWTYGRKLLFGSGNSSFGWRPWTYPFYCSSTVIFPSIFTFLELSLINEEITSSVLLCKPIYQRHFYSNDFKNKPFPFFAQKKIPCIFCMKMNLITLLGYLFPEMAVAILTMITFRLVGS